MSATSRRCVSKNVLKTPDDSESSIGSSVMGSLPKHIPFPYVEEPSDFLIEGFSFVVALFALGCQYLELYKTVWWMPEYANKQSLHFELVDKVVIVFIVAILARKFVFMFVYASVRFLKKRSKSHHALTSCIPNMFAIQFCCLLGACIFDVYLKLGFLNLLSLCYPLVLYVVIFGLRLEPFFRTVFESPAKYFDGTPVHCCSNVAATVRSEIDGLRIDCNNRFKQTIFSSIVFGYAGFMPYWLVDSHVVYDPLAVLLNAVFIWLSGLTLCAVQCFPPRYCDILHRAAMHLGQWERQEDSSGSYMGIFSWSSQVRCVPGTLIRYEGGVYRATGPTNTAIPGNKSHARFYAIFKNPTTLYGVMATVQLLLMGTQFLRLYHSTTWSTLISLSYLISTNFVTMYCYLRNLRIVQAIYSVESAHCIPAGPGDGEVQ